MLVIAAAFKAIRKLSAGRWRDEEVMQNGLDQSGCGHPCQPAQQRIIGKAKDTIAIHAEETDWVRCQ